MILHSGEYRSPPVRKAYPLAECGLAPDRTVRLESNAPRRRRRRLRGGLRGRGRRWLRTRAGRREVRNRQPETQRRMNVSGAALVIWDTVAEAAFRPPSKGLGLQGKDRGLGSAPVLRGGFSYVEYRRVQRPTYIRNPNTRRRAGPSLRLPGTPRTGPMRVFLAKSSGTRPGAKTNPF